MITWEWIKNRKPVNISIKSRMEGNVMVVYGKTLEISYLNKVGSRILQLSDGNNTIEDICNKLLQIYAVEKNELQADIVDLIRELQWKRLVRLEE